MSTKFYSTSAHGEVRPIRTLRNSNGEIRRVRVCVYTFAAVHIPEWYKLYSKYSRRDMIIDFS